MTKHIQLFLKTITVQTLIVMVLSLVSTLICIRYEVIVNLPLDLISVAIVFPIVFSIGAAYQRRERALEAFGALKSHLITLYFAHRDWLVGDTSEHTDRCQHLILNLLTQLSQYFEARSEHQPEPIYKLFSDLSLSIEALRQAGLTVSEISGLAYYLQNIVFNFEVMNGILLYRTPTALRAYSDVFLGGFPILFGPYFAFLSKGHFFSFGLIVAAIYSLVLMSLDNIQSLLENPFDNLGSDDLNLNISSSYQNFLQDRVSAQTSQKPIPVQS